ncbi:UDP-N-acetylmuramoyl-L-alanine--D-glutamate ligase [Ancylobacter dichloromethanicus]|uniref:UDP-N-acetylmuramoylalanine--D-glutamate ligase n=1 Tax=Ancylobacter dichloromethanicus TaxID=518825 RepID=A0A9W6J5X4_9HYPH|nr:UDP-N-acetylmuramoyl-L-alanine--D-glutamate ligase [Ancylobacter dichloromethanicus]MBS7555221.1 UDP-N-acetylmuramoyl-L-alanine--D-glutamate ligase [Ancylobacter dichloromethanicus]GLK70401.1 UDP-N-acetylmuramoylalanine--D-glutamate ligase [Ancylobacter dichloromethanicus]
MIPVTSFKDRAVALFGLGGSGLATARALIAGGATVTAWDDSPASVEKAAAESIPTGDLRAADWSGFAALVLAPGVPLTHPALHWTVQAAQAAGVEIIGDIELFCRERRRATRRPPFAAITGTNGKSTTTALLAHLLKVGGRDVQIGGNFGPAILGLEPPKPGRVYVIECSSYQIDLAPSLDPAVGVLLNLSPDHIDRHGTMENYAAVKERLVAGVEAGGTAVIGVDDDWSRAIADRTEAAGKRVARISVRQKLEDGVFLDGADLVESERGRRKFTFSINGIGSLRGAHNAQNAAAAYAAARALGLAPEVIAAGMASFPGLAHRMEQVRTIGNVLFVNDSKATNADAAERALTSFDDIFWIAGGRPKEGGIEPLRPCFPRIRKAYLIGVAADEFAATLGEDVPFEICGTLDVAVARAAEDAASAAAISKLQTESNKLPDAVVLLSPACASFDQYRNFEVRGDAFRDLVNALPEA